MLRSSHEFYIYKMHTHTHSWPHGLYRYGHNVNMIQGETGRRTLTKFHPNCPAQNGEIPRRVLNFDSNSNLWFIHIPVILSLSLSFTYPLNHLSTPTLSLSLLLQQYNTLYRLIYQDLIPFTRLKISGNTPFVSSAQIDT